METFALKTIENGGAIGVLFVIFLLGFGWCYFKIKGHDVRIDVAVILRGKKEDGDGNK